MTSFLEWTASLLLISVIGLRLSAEWPGVGPAIFWGATFGWGWCLGNRLSRGR